MKNNFMHKVQTIIGIGLLLLTILGFILMVLLNLPKDDAVKSKAKLLKSDPELFSSTDATNQKIKSLKVPSNIPVTIDQASLGRADVFQGL